MRRYIDKCEQRRSYRSIYGENRDSSRRDQKYAKTDGIRTQNKQSKKEVITSHRVSIKSMLCVKDLKFESKKEENQPAWQTKDRNFGSSSKDLPKDKIVPITIPPQLVESINSSLLKECSQPSTKINLQFAQSSLQNLDDCLNDDVP